MKQFLYIFLACIIGGLLITETGNASICDNKESIVFFGNGVITLKKKAYDSQEIIKDSLYNEYAEGKKSVSV